MKPTLAFLVLVFTTIAYCQDAFVFNENGITPGHIISKVDSAPKAALYSKTLQWIKNTDAVVDVYAENDFIQLIGTTTNAINEGKRYFHMKYVIKISFENETYKFELLEIQLKANSKYDMGWMDFNLKDGSPFFKKGKVIKKLRSYVIDIPKILNELNTNLYNHLIAEED
ncbi:hypothetical protein [Winogradskyella flava]|uniref:hypothetical protein n=1 Tax=Winogradskyella flava TaxID=1884876 RepID=UPI002491B274|nr:hypothetical protein [Winogradskyella flava]